MNKIVYTYFRKIGYADRKADMSSVFFLLYKGQIGGHTMSKEKIIGKTFFYLTVKKEIKKPGSRTLYLCKCKCGNEVKIPKSRLTSGNTKSCKCYKKEKDKLRFYKHGLSKKKHSLYSVWNGMKQRCSNRNNPDYHNYGKRGIYVCDEWQNNFKAFYDWAINNGWKKGLTIDRTDNNGNYEPSNCRFVTLYIQAINKQINSKNTSGYTGVNKDKHNHWISNISYLGKKIYLGYFKTKQEALQARNRFIRLWNLPHKIQDDIEKSYIKNIIGDIREEK